MQNILIMCNGLPIFHETGKSLLCNAFMVTKCTLKSLKTQKPSNQNTKIILFVLEIKVKWGPISPKLF